GFDFDEPYTFSHMAGDSLVVNRGSSIFVVTSRFGSKVSNEEYLRFIKSCRIQSHSSKAGIKKVVFTLFSEGMDSPPASFLYETRPIYTSGEDVELLVCKDTVISNLSVALNGDQEGEWFPPLASGNDAFDSRLDVASVYEYISSDSMCPSDTAVLTIIRDVEPGNTFALKSCTLDTVWLDLDIEIVEDFVWED